MNEQYITSIVRYQIEDKWLESHVTTTAALSNEDAKKILGNNTAYVSKTLTVAKSNLLDWVPTFRKRGEIWHPIL